MESIKERRIEQVREELGKRSDIAELWRAQLKIVAERVNSFHGAKSTLEVGCGNGAIHAYLDTRFHYSGVDPIECKNADFEFRQGSAEAIPYPDSSFDLVLIKDAANYFRELGPVLGEAMRVLKPEGALLITEHVGAKYRPWLQKLKNIAKKHLHLRRNIWDKTYSNYYSSDDILGASKRLGLSASYSYTSTDLRYFLTVRRSGPSNSQTSNLAGRPA
jgi:ubiquinone/menaquinone biosynthesis C-methylase UbiE